MRTTWNGSLSFGLVTIPVGLAPATTPKARASDVSFRTLHRECKTPIKQKRWCPTHEREVSNDEIVKGWEVSKGQFVIVVEADLEAIAQHDTSRSIDISRFVPLEQVDPLFFDRTYYLSPSTATAQRRPYVLLLEAMKETGMAAIGRMVIRGNENLCLIRPKGDALVLETLFLAEDVRSQAEIDEAVGRAEGTAQRGSGQPAPAPGGEAEGRGDLGARAGRGGPGRRSDGSAQEERRRHEEKVGLGRSEEHT